MKKHVHTVHEGHKDYECQFCGKLFALNSTRHTHIDTVHKGLKKYQCSICDKAYGQSGDLKKHVQRCHPEAEPPIRQRTKFPSSEEPKSKIIFSSE